MRFRNWVFCFFIGATVAAEPSDMLALRRSAREALRSGDTAAAIRDYEILVQANPADGGLWEALGSARLKAGQYEPSIAAYRQSVAAGVHPATGFYNIACALSLAGDTEGAIDALEQAYSLGFADEHLLQNDADLRSLHDLPRFRRLVGWAEPGVEVRRECWQRDIEFLDRRLREVHWDLFGVLPERDYVRAKEELLASIEQRSDLELEWDLRRWLARIGDGHTAFALDELLARHLGPHAEVEILPLQFFEFEDGVRVRAVTPELASLAGARVLAIGAVPIDSLVARVDAGCSRDNEHGARWMRMVLLGNPRVLRALGAESTGGGFLLRCVDRFGAEASIELRAGGGENLMARRPHWELSDIEPSMALREPDSSLHLEPDPQHDLLYVRIDSVQDTPQESLADFALRATATRRELKFGHLVLDLRNNHGGQGELMQPLLHELIRDEEFRTPGALYVLIGRETFSAAMVFAAQLEVHCAVRFVGEPSGSRPNFVGETTLVRLPYSQRWLSISSRYHQNGRSDDRRLWIAPVLPAAPSYALEREGRDPGLEAIYAEVGPH